MKGDKSHDILRAALEQAGASFSAHSDHVREADFYVPALGLYIACRDDVTTVGSTPGALLRSANVILIQGEGAARQFAYLLNRFQGVEKQLRAQIEEQGRMISDLQHGLEEAARLSGSP